MLDLSPTIYLWVKALHVISVIAWMAGMLYLPRLYVYHAETDAGSEASETFKVMERRLLRGIMNPAMIATLVFGGILLAHLWPSIGHDAWLHIKLTCVIGLLVFHMLLARWRRGFAEDRNTHPPKFYRMVNEVPTILMVIIVVMVIVRP